MRSGITVAVPSVAPAANGGRLRARLRSAVPDLEAGLARDQSPLEVEGGRAGHGRAVGVAAADLQRAGALVGDRALDVVLEPPRGDVLEHGADGVAAADDERVAGPVVAVLDL